LLLVRFAARMHRNEGVPIMSENHSSREVASSDGSPTRRPSALWRILTSGSGIYAGFALMAAFAFWDARTPVTMISPFQLPKADLPFNGIIVADALQDALRSIHNEVETARQDPSLQSSETGLPDLRNMLIPNMRRVQAPPRFTVEVKGLSYERILCVARAVLHTESTVSGDVIVKGNEFTLIARTGDAGPWVSVSSPITAEGLARASRDLAEKIVAAEDPIVAGVALLKNGHVDEGLAALKRSRSLDTDSRLKMNLCMGLAANRRYDQAIECYQNVLRMNPRSPEEVQERLAQVLYLHGDRDDAIKSYQELYKRGYRHALLGLGEALDDTNHPNEAMKLYNEFLTAESLDRNLAIAHVKKGDALAHLGRHDEALSEYQQALKYAPRDALILVHKGIELARAGDLAAGIAQIKSVVDENEDVDSIPFARLQLGRLLQQSGDWQRAIEQFRLASERRPTYVEAHLYLARALVHDGRRVRALVEFNKVLRLSPSDVERGYSQILASQWLGNELRELGDYSGAASAYREAIRLSPDYGAAHCQLGVLLQKQGDLREAIYHYRAALVPAKAKELNDTQCIITAQHQVEKVLASKEKHGAERMAELQEVQELEHRLWESYYALGKTLYEEGKFVEAATEYKQAVKINPRSAAIHNLLGLALDKQSLVEQAVLEYRSAVGLEPDNAYYQANLEHELALEHLKRNNIQVETVAKLN
jgi:tetratricopeptide (TPR) repeat protein